jgi:hypothetical protein
MKCLLIFFLFPFKLFAQNLQITEGEWKSTSHCYQCLTCDQENASSNEEEYGYYSLTYKKDAETFEKEIKIKCNDLLIGTYKIFRHTDCNGYYYKTDIYLLKRGNSFVVVEEEMNDEFRNENSAIALIKKDALEYCTAKEPRGTNKELYEKFEKKRQEIANSIPETNIPDSNLINSTWLIITNAKNEYIRFPHTGKVYNNMGMLSDLYYSWKFLPGKKLMEVTMANEVKKKVYSIVKTELGYKMYSIVNNKVDSTSNVVPIRFGSVEGDKYFAIRTPEYKKMLDSLVDINQIKNCKSCGNKIGAAFTVGRGAYGESFNGKPIQFRCQLINGKPQWVSTIGDNFYFGDPGFCLFKNGYYSYSVLTPGYYNGTSVCVVFKYADVYKKGKLIRAGKYTAELVSLEIYEKMKKGIFPEMPAPPKEKKKPGLFSLF